MKFALSDKRLSCIIPGATNGGQCAANMAVAELAMLTPDAIEELRKWDMEDMANP